MGGAEGSQSLRPFLLFEVSFAFLYGFICATKLVPCRLVAILRKTDKQFSEPKTCSRRGTLPQDKRSRSEPRLATGCCIPLCRFLLQETGGEGGGVRQNLRVPAWQAHSSKGNVSASFSLVIKVECASALRGIALNVLRRGMCSSATEQTQWDASVRKLCEGEIPAATRDSLCTDASLHSAVHQGDNKMFRPDGTNVPIIDLGSCFGNIAGEARPVDNPLEGEWPRERTLIEVSERDGSVVLAVRVQRGRARMRLPVRWTGH